MSFVELLARSNFSFLQGASHPEEMALRALVLGYEGLALCDLNGLYGSVRAHRAIHNPSPFFSGLEEHLDFIAAEKARKKFKYIVGSEVQLPDKSSVALLPINKAGYQNLCHLITLSKMQAPKTYSQLSLEKILECNEDLIAFPLPPWKKENLNALRSAFSDRIYLPVWRDYTWESLQHNRAALEEDLPAFATQRPLMHHPYRKPLMDVLSSIHHGVPVTSLKTRGLSNSERHLKPLKELQEIWRDRPDLLARTTEIASRIQFSLSELKYQYPQEALPEGLTPSEHLRRLVESGLKRRFPSGVSPQVRSTVEHELTIIRDLNYEDYFLTLWDICQFALERKILHQGRGSAANSVVCYALGLTAVNPTEIQLLFERFISKERGEPPDIDIDFESGRREEVIQYIYEKYGRRHAAMVATVICYRSRMAVREVAKVLGASTPQIDNMIKFMGREGFKRLQSEVAKGTAPQFGLNPQKLQWLLKLSGQLIGFPRHLGIHTGGFVISQRPVTESVPVERASMDGRHVIQWNKDDINELKMMKVDVLGLGMLTTLTKSFELLKKHKAIQMDLSQLPPNDPKTYEMIQRADTVGTFQIESRAQMSLLPRHRPKTFYDLVVQVALIRPGPITGGLVHPYIRRKNGEEAVSFPHPDLEPILGKTFGVPIFQEQIMQVASAVAGFTPGEADELRRLMSSSWKTAEVMGGVRQRLISGMLSHGLSLSSAEQIYKSIEGFAAYGFPESHAASFALLTYASCFLKAHHPEIFVCALLNSQPMGFYSPRALVADAQRHGVQFLPLDIQNSDFDYTLSPSRDSRLAVRLGLRSIFGLRQDHAERLLMSRKKMGPFKNLKDLVQRTGDGRPRFPRAALMSLASAGALSSFDDSVRSLIWQIQAVNLDENSLLFGLAKERFFETKALESWGPENAWDALQREYLTKGYALENHPLSLLRPALNKKSWEMKKAGQVGYVSSEELRRIPSGRAVRVAGLISCHQRPPTAKGFSFLTLEDERGLINVILLPKIYEKYRALISQRPLLEVFGRIENHRGVVNLKAQVLSTLGRDSFQRNLQHLGHRI